jgi:hypothetical protein
MEEINEGVMDAFKAALKASGISDINPQDLGDNGLATLGKSGNPRFKDKLGASDGDDVMVYDIIMLYAAHAFRAGGGELEKSQAQYLKKVTKGLYTLWKKKDDKSMQQYYNWIDYLASQNAGKAAGKVSASEGDIEAALVTAGEAGREAGRRDAEVRAGERMRAHIAEKYPEVWKELQAAETPEEEAAILKKHPEVAEAIKKFGFGDSFSRGDWKAEAGAEEAEEMAVHLYSKDPDGGETIGAQFKKYDINDRVTKSIIDSIAAQLKANGITVKEGKEMDFLVSEVVALMEGRKGRKNSRKNRKSKKAVSPGERAKRKEQSDRDKAANGARRGGTKKKPASAPVSTSTEPEKSGRSGGGRQPSNAWKKRGQDLGTEWIWGDPSTKDMSLIQWKNKVTKKEKELKNSVMKRRRDRLGTKQYGDILGDVNAQVTKHGRAKKGRLNVGPLISNALKAGGYEKDVRNKLAIIIKKAFKDKAEKLGIRLTESKINSLTEEAVTTLLAKRVIKRIDSDGML